MWRKAILTAVLLLVLYPSESRSQYYEGFITLDPVIGQVGPYGIGIGQIILPLRAMYFGPSGTYVVGSNSFELYSPDGASISAIEGVQLAVWASLFTHTYQAERVRLLNDPDWWLQPDPTPPFDLTYGYVAGIGFAGVTYGLPPTLGMPAFYNEVAWKIRFVTSAADTGLTICFDQATLPAYEWIWVSLPNDDWIPEWNYGNEMICFEIEPVILTNPSDPPGSPVEVEASEDLTLTFGEVTSPGVTTVTTQTTGPPVPGGYHLFPPDGEPVYYDIVTTATYSGQIELCFSYAGMPVSGPEANLRLLHWSGDPLTWNDITSSVDVVADVICGLTSSLSLFALVEPVPTQSIAGQVVADCPAPLTGLPGVDVDAFTLGTGDLVGTAVTDVDGHYLIADLPAADYTLTLVTPLGFSTEIDEILIEEQPGQTVVVDFALTCVDITANPRGIGFWKHQVGVALGGRGQAQIDGPTLCDHLDLIANHFNSNEINQVIVYDPPVSTICADKLLVAKGLLNLKGNVGVTARAKQQLTALLLNVAAGYISQVDVISEDGATVSQAITYSDNLIDDPGGDHEIAKTICDDINNGRPISAGIIPLSTARIAYKQLPGTYSLFQNYPNPFNPATAISFSLQVGSPVKLEVFNSTGQSVTTLINRHVDAGHHSVTWDAGDMASGVYFYRLTVGEFMETKKMVLLK